MSQKPYLSHKPYLAGDVRVKVVLMQVSISGKKLGEKRNKKGPGSLAGILSVRVHSTCTLAFWNLLCFRKGRGIEPWPCVGAGLKSILACSTSCQLTQYSTATVAATWSAEGPGLEVSTARKLSKHWKVRAYVRNCMSDCAS